MGGRLNLDGGTLNLDGGTRPPRPPYNFGTANNWSLGQWLAFSVGY